MSSPAIQLLEELHRLGVELRVSGDLLQFRPPEKVTPELRTRLKASKPELMRLVARKVVGNARSPVPSEVPRRARLHITEGPLDFGDICAGWTPSAWAEELRRKADRCEDYRPDIAHYYRAWSADIERRLGIPSDTEINS